MKTFVIIEPTPTKRDGVYWEETFFYYGETYEKNYNTN